VALEDRDQRAGGHGRCRCGRVHNYGVAQFAKGRLVPSRRVRSRLAVTACAARVILVRLVRLHLVCAATAQEPKFIGAPRGAPGREFLESDDCRRIRSRDVLPCPLLDPLAPGADPLPVQFAKRVRLVAQCGRVLACIIREPSRGQLGSTVTTSPAISGWPPDPGRVPPPAIASPCSLEDVPSECVTLPLRAETP